DTFGRRCGKFDDLGDTHRASFVAAENLQDGVSIGEEGIIFSNFENDGLTMSLHLIKLCVGVNEIDELVQWVKDAKAGREELCHVTRMFPRRKHELLPNGSLYWVIRGMILCRQPIADLVAVRGRDGIERCRIEFKAKIIPVRPAPRRAFQGWRYLEA